MPTSADIFRASLAATRSAARALPGDLALVRELGDDELLAAQRALAEARRAVDACASLVAGEIGVRSRRELGYGGLAQREGFRTPEALVQHATGATSKEATTLVRVGALVRDAAEPGIENTETGPVAGGPVGGAGHREPWLRAIGAAVGRGELSIDAAQAIRNGLGSPRVDGDGRGITVADLTTAATTLLAEAGSINADRLFRRARDLRDELDAAGIAERERAIHGERSVRRVRRANGISRYIIDPDIESAAFWDDAYDKLTSPRRGGPRFADPQQKEWADAIASDERSTEQYAHDAFTELLRIGSRADTPESRRVIGSPSPAVRVLVTEESLSSRRGHARIEGGDIPVSIETAERAACSAGTVTIAFDATGRPLNLGRTQRLFNGSQRIVLAVRDGGCRWPGCDRPPSWCEAHHIEHWHRDTGKTDVDDGVLLCRHHHMLLHNNHWQIQREDSACWLVPPPDVDPARTRRPMPSKSAALRDLRHGAA